MPTFIGTSEAPYTHDAGTVCLGDVVELTADEAARGLASGQIAPVAAAPKVVAPKPAPATAVPESNEEV